MYKNKIFKSPTVIVGLFVVIGAALRIGGMFSPLTHDELSAICRLQYDNLSDVLTYGVKPDGHPGGVQVFMWLWAQLFGTSAIALRLPFVLMGIATMPLIYSIGRRWYGEWSALLPTAVVSVSQYTVYYSILARPYCPGLFFILCTLYFLTLMVKEKRYTLFRLILFALFAACCAYTHYFCLLTALLMALGALFFVGKRHLLSYLASCLSAILLFMPHIRITLYQLFELKGIGGWLGAPTPTFPLEYLRYLTHHSWIAALVTVVAYALLFRPRTARQHLPLMAASLAVALLPLVIGYVYSVSVNPVLQFSGLLFAFPFLLLALAGGLRDEAQGWRTAAITGAYVTTMVATLFINRRHYSMLQQEWVEASVEMAQDAMTQYGHDNVICLFQYSPCMASYYDSALNLIPQDVLLNANSLDSALSQCTTPYLVCAGIQDPRILKQIHRHYPTLLQMQPRVVSELYFLSRQPADNAIDLDRLFTTVTEQPLAPFDGEFHNLLDTNLAALIDNRFACIESQLLFRQTDSVQKPLYLVTELICGKRKLDWREVHTTPTDSIGDIVLPIRVEGIVKHQSQLKRTQIKVYLWNPEGNTDIQPLSCRIRVIPTSPWMFSVLEEI